MAFRIVEHIIDSILRNLEEREKPGA